MYLMEPGWIMLDAQQCLEQWHLLLDGRAIKRKAAVAAGCGM